MKKIYVIMRKNYGSTYPINSFPTKERALKHIRDFERIFPPTKEEHFFIAEISNYE